MRLVIEGRFEDDIGAVPISLGSIERSGSAGEAIGLSLAEGRALLGSVQEQRVRVQCQAVSASLSKCPECGESFVVKGQHERTIRTVFGYVRVPSPRLRYCACRHVRLGASFSPLVHALPAQMTPDLEYLQVTDEAGK